MTPGDGRDPARADRERAGPSPEDGRAETYLRLCAESELRRALTLPRYEPPAPPGLPAPLRLAAGLALPLAERTAEALRPLANGAARALQPLADRAAAVQPVAGEAARRLQPLAWQAADRLRMLRYGTPQALREWRWRVEGTIATVG